MDFKGQKLAELIGVYLIAAVAAVAFTTGWLLGSFALMAQVGWTPALHRQQAYAAAARLV